MLHLEGSALSTMGTLPALRSLELFVDKVRETPRAHTTHVVVWPPSTCVLSLFLCSALS